MSEAGGISTHTSQQVSGCGGAAAAGRSEGERASEPPFQGNCLSGTSTKMKASSVSEQGIESECIREEEGEARNLEGGQEGFLCGSRQPGLGPAPPPAAGADLWQLQERSELERVSLIN